MTAHCLIGPMEASDAFDLEFDRNVKQGVHLLQPCHFPDTCPPGALCGPRKVYGSLNAYVEGWGVSDCDPLDRDSTFIATARTTEQTASAQHRALDHESQAIVSPAVWHVYATVTRLPVL